MAKGKPRGRNSVTLVRLLNNVDWAVLWNSYRMESYSNESYEGCRASRLRAHDPQDTNRFATWNGVWYYNCDCGRCAPLNAALRRYATQ